MGRCRGYLVVVLGTALGGCASQGRVNAPKDAATMPVEIVGTEENLRFSVAEWSDPPERAPVFAKCAAPCALELAPGSYRLGVAGQPGDDVRTSYRRVDLAQPSRLTIDPPSETLRSLGLAAAVLGPISMLAGMVVVVQGTPANAQSDTSKDVVGSVLILGGATLTAGGWTLYALNGPPTIKSERLVTTGASAARSGPF